jgi:NADPH-dependent 2,4-dienoyl-CoA reductase/sulfur reductase-like enzyme
MVAEINKLDLSQGYKFPHDYTGITRLIKGNDMARKLLIIGSGMAGGKLVEELLPTAKDLWDTDIIGVEPEGNYNRIKLNYCLGSDEPEDFFLNPPSWYLQKGVDAILGHRAVSIDRTARTVTLENDRVLSYDRLVLATGSRPFVPNIRNRHLPTVTCQPSWPYAAWPTPRLTNATSPTAAPSRSIATRSAMAW